MLWRYELNTLVFYASRSLSAQLFRSARPVAGRVLRALAGKADRRVAAWILRFAAFFCRRHARALVLGGARLLPASGITDLRLAYPGIGSYAAHLVLPVTTVTLLTIASLSRYFGEAVHEELGRDYVRTARAKGVEFRRHPVPPCAAQRAAPAGDDARPVLPVYFHRRRDRGIGFQLSRPGWLMWRSALSQDYPILIAIVLIIGLLTVIGNLLADLVNGLLDPRASYE